MSALEDTLAFQLRALGITGWTREYRWHAAVAWRADFAFPAAKLLVEIEGGTYIAGRHSRGAEFAKDCLKYAAALLDGWGVLRFTTEHVTDGWAVDIIALALAGGTLPPLYYPPTKRRRKLVGEE